MAKNHSEQTPADRSFTNLRAAGHTGWVNADGEIPTSDNTSAETLKVYKDAQRAFDRHRG